MGNTIHTTEELSSSTNEKLSSGKLSETILCVLNCFTHK